MSAYNRMSEARSTSEDRSTSADRIISADKILSADASRLQIDEYNLQTESSLQINESLETEGRGLGGGL